jgi:hypothetical protein
MRWLPALLLVIVFVFPLFMGGFACVAVATFAFDRDLYAGLLSDERLYDMPDAVSAASWQLSIPGLSAFPRTMGKAALRELLPPAYLRSQALNVMDQAFAYLRGRGSLNLWVDLGPLKRSLASDGGRRFALTLAQGLPQCTGSTAAPARGTIPACRPSGWTVQQTAQFIQASLPAVISRMPDRAALSASTPLPWRGFSAPGMLAAAAAGLIALGLGAWFASAFAFSSSPRDRKLWLGSTLLAPALCTLIIGLVSLSPFTFGWARYGIEAANLARFGLGQGYSDAVVDAAGIFIRRFSIGFLAVGGIASGLGLGLLIWGATSPIDRLAAQRSDVHASKST